MKRRESRRWDQAERDQLVPIPGSVALEIDFIDNEEMSEEEYKEEVKKAVRRGMHSADMLEAPGPITTYDPEVWKIIREVVLEG